MAGQSHLQDIHSMWVDRARCTLPQKVSVSHSVTRLLQYRRQTHKVHTPFHLLQVRHLLC